MKFSVTYQQIILLLKIKMSFPQKNTHTKKVENFSSFFSGKLQIKIPCSKTQKNKIITFVCSALRSLSHLFLLICSFPSPFFFLPFSNFNKKIISKSFGSFHTQYSNGAGFYSGFYFEIGVGGDQCAQAVRYCFFATLPK